MTKSQIQREHKVDLLSFNTCPVEYVVPSERKSVRIKKSHSKPGKAKNLIIQQGEDLTFGLWNLTLLPCA
ncbi:MAG: hypothetical protein P8175_10895, partial [Deltaproteobacteria bacterium]